MGNRWVTSGADEANGGLVLADSVTMVTIQRELPLWVRSEGKRQWKGGRSTEWGQNPGDRRALNLES